MAAALHLAREVARVINISVYDAMETIWNASPTCHQLIATPEGWAVLACYVADMCGKPMPSLSNGVQKGPPIGVEEGPPFQII